ncbi:hypothetical protein DYB25_004442 [Aphanomyces astaci]|uniref:EF-hand domain-containing protein n=1 Tax=Aphanomyces astaci TaxID=112090 RepID=A0A396ZWE4_APHAT|nr:hypothetical protein DYB36_014074 [Aphanomyces astaci]RHY11756.1 hypothetical protein DYB25_004442 [Aphanomyces astaci]RHY42382.1 hypothetical protein DYB34_000832 [Aphanomyces astaci]RHY55727.1 hypothetical protein DYB30_003353 [Aphanomyces astaci]RHZ17161.1 hypothetical protein DYB26_009950 [Aphanomyces astaci]
MSSKRSKKDGETKTEGDGDKKKSKSKKKEKASSKEPKEPKEPKEKAPVVEPPTTTLAPPPPVIEQPEINDPDAIQLFRRYDREKANHVTRSDFLDLLRDYTTWYPGRKWNMPVMPCALTDAAGVPLGFERTSRNSEFEAGQLFERFSPHISIIVVRAYCSSSLVSSCCAANSLTGMWWRYVMKSSHRVFDTRHLYESKLDQLHALSEKTLRHLQLQVLVHTVANQHPLEYYILE